MIIYDLMSFIVNALAATASFSFCSTVRVFPSHSRLVLSSAGFVEQVILKALNRAQSTDTCHQVVCSVIKHICVLGYVCFIIHSGSSCGMHNAFRKMASAISIKLGTDIVHGRPGVGLYVNTTAHFFIFIVFCAGTSENHSLDILPLHTIRFLGDGACLFHSGSEYY